MQATHYAVALAGVLPLNVDNTWGIGDLVTVGRDGTVDPLSVAIPDNCILERVEIELANTVGAASIAMRIFRDAACDYPFYLGSAAAWTTGITTAAELTAIYYFTRPYARSANSVAGRLYMLFKTDAGTVDVTAIRVYWTARNE